MLPADPDRQREVGAFLQNLVPQGATEHDRALRSALRHRPNVLYWLTDGGEPPLTARQIESIAESADSAGTRIICVAFGRESAAGDDSFVRKLAQRSGGGYTRVDVSRIR
jgi:hypothetical protein